MADKAMVFREEDYQSSKLVYPPMFPSHIAVNGVEITLNADGSWSGDGQAFLAALAKADSGGVQGWFIPTLWLVANQIRADIARAAGAS